MYDKEAQRNKQPKEKMNLWNSIPTFNTISNPFSLAEVNCVIEITKDTNVKYEYDTALGVFKLDRCLISAMRYPCNYGFIPQTVGDDGDPLDVIIYSGAPLMTGTLVSGNVIGALDMEDKGKKDYKILVVPSFNSHKITSLASLEENYLEIVKDFFSHYKNVSQSKVVVKDWIGRESALEIVRQCSRK